MMKTAINTGTHHTFSRPFTPEAMGMISALYGGAPESTRCHSALI